MNIRSLHKYFFVAVAALLVACGGGGGGIGDGIPPIPTPNPKPTPKPKTQVIAFAEAGPINVLLGSVTNNTASGGGGVGAVTYVSSNTNAVIVNQTSGAATAVGVGTATITATKAADAHFLQAQATYTINSQTANKISAFIGATGTEVNLPASAAGRQLVRARVTDCSATDTVATCANAEVSPVSAISLSDTRATLTTPAYYALMDGSTLGTPIDVRANRFSNRIGHGSVYFNNRYWVIGGGEPVLPNSGAGLQHIAKSDVWSSADGKTWKLETADGGFGARWFHQAVVFNNRIWIISGTAIPAQTPLPWYSDVWSSADGVTWTQEAIDANFPWWSTDLNVVVFNNEMLAVSGGRVYSSTTGVFAPKAGGTVVLTGTSLGRTHASLTVYNNHLWYIGGKVDFPITSPPDGDAMNDVWQSADGVTWNQVISNGNAPFSPRYRHSAFVAGGKLWILGGQGATNGVEGAQAGDAWSTTNGIDWIQENVNSVARNYFMSVIQEPDKATLIGGIQVGYANNVLQTADGTNWSELSSFAQFSARHTKGVEFNGRMWVIGGVALDGRMNDRNTNEIWHSADGINWSPVATTGPIFSPRDGHGVAVFNNRLWVIGGWNNPSGGTTTQVRMNDVWSSADGVTWQLETAAAAFVPRVGHGATAINGRLWVIGGNTGTGNLNDVWSSTDGVTWTQTVASAAFSPRVSPAVVSLNNEMWLIGGGTVNGSNDIWHSADGINWAQFTTTGTVFAPRTRHAAAVLNGRVYVVGGTSSEDYFTGIPYNDVWSSADGTTWRQETSSAAFAPRSLHTLIAHGNELWVVGGLSAGVFNDVWRSSDAVNWRVGFSHEIPAP